LLPESKQSHPVIPFGEIIAIRGYPLTNLSPEIREAVRKLEMGLIRTPTLTLDHDYNLIATIENFNNWLVCYVAAVSAVRVKVIRQEENAFHHNRLMLQSFLPAANRTRFLDDAQLDLDPASQDEILARPHEEDEDEVEEPYEEEPYEEETVDGEE
jgi:hypothetical protein